VRDNERQPLNPSERGIDDEMTAKQSAGILLFRFRAGALELFLAHPGGPFWARKDDGAWSIPKGGFSEDEEPLAAAKREFFEEIGTRVEGTFIPLGDIKQPSGKIVYVWAVQRELDPSTVASNTFTLEWPPKSGRQQEFPEIDRAGWFTLPVAGRKILKGQEGFIERLVRELGIETDKSEGPEA
jgi:predicted NUDIX family NTP pyrophosphohydrolase